MKKTFITQVLMLAAGLTFGCGKPAAPPTGTPSPSVPGQAKNTSSNSSKVSAEKNSFSEIAQHLDLGGHFFLYLSTEQVIPKIEEKVKLFAEVGIEALKASGEFKKETEIGLKIAQQFLVDSGLREISGFGASSFALEKGYYRNRGMLHHYPGRGQGGFWQLLGGKVHEQGVLKLLPTSTAMVSHGDLDALRIYDWFKKLSKDHGDLPWAAEFNKSLGEAEKKFGVEKTLRTYGGEIGMAVTLHPTRTITLPGGIKLPEPGLALFLKVKDDTLQKLLASTTQAFEPKTEKVGDTTITYHDIPLPAEVPMKVSASYFMAGGYLVFTSSVELAKEILAVQSGGKGLVGTDEFKTLAKDMDLKGNQIHFVSRRISEVFIEIQKAALATQPDEATRSLMQKLFTSTEKASGLVVVRCLPEGVLYDGHVDTR